MNQIFVPIERVYLETVFEKGGRVDYALLEPGGGVTPLRMRFSDLRLQLEERFSAELPPETIVERISAMKDEQLLVVIHLDREGSERVELSIRRRYPFEQRPANVSEQRRSKRVRPDQPTDVRVDLGDGSIEGTIYNIYTDYTAFGIHDLTGMIARHRGQIGTDVFTCPFPDAFCVYSVDSRRISEPLAYLPIPPAAASVDRSR